MARHFNPSITQDAIRIFNTKINDNVANEVAPIIRAVVPLEPVIDIVFNVAATATGTSVIGTTPVGKDFYLVYAYLSFEADSTYDGTSVVISATINGVARIIMESTNFSGSVRDVDVTIQPRFPIKLDRGTAINLIKTFTAGTGAHAATVGGYIREVTK